MPVYKFTTNNGFAQPDLKKVEDLDNSPNTFAINLSERLNGKTDPFAILRIFETDYIRDKKVPYDYEFQFLLTFLIHGLQSCELEEAQTILKDARI